MSARAASWRLLGASYVLRFLPSCAAMMLVLVSALPSRAADSSAPLVVQTDEGLIRGSIMAGVRRFAGVRYAAPPTGDLRWRPPQPAPVHAATADATSFGSQCPQATGTGTDPNEGGNEDCLFLNIYTPAHTASWPLPVMVFIHGGAFIEGTGATYVPDSMVNQGQVIVVTINYRLGPLGALALPQLDSESPVLKSGAYTLLDQQAALRWVQRNIPRFGGNPAAMTLFGESAGATYTCLNVVSPTAAGLFQGAISESGCGLPSEPLSISERFGETIAQQLGCGTGSSTDLACLRSKTPLAITQAALAAAGGSASGVQTASTPATGGSVLPLAAYDAFRSGSFNHVPVIIGTNRNEGRTFVYGGSYGPPPTTEASYLVAVQSAIASVVGVTVSQVAEEYPFSAYPSGAEALSAVTTDSSFACRTFKADQLASHKVPLFGYQFTDPNAPSALGGPSLGASHGSELFYLFDMGATLTPQQQALSRTMISYWTSFARFHEPDTFAQPFWIPFFVPVPHVPAVLQNLAPNAVGPNTAASFNTEHHCDFWSSHLL